MLPRAVGMPCGIWLHLGDSLDRGRDGVAGSRSTLSITDEKFATWTKRAARGFSRCVSRHARRFFFSITMREVWYEAPVISINNRSKLAFPGLSFDIKCAAGNRRSPTGGLFQPYGTDLAECADPQRHAEGELLQYHRDH
jgi:hypothetical protein